MKNLKTEYKLLILLGSLFLIILTFALIRVNYFGKKLDEHTLKEKEYISCKEEHLFKGVNYTNHTCEFKDDGRDSFSISYPSIDINSKDVNNLNKKLKEQFEEIKKEIKFNKAGKEFFVNKINSLKYEIYNYGDLLSVLIINTDNGYDYYSNDVKYKSYNINIKSGKIIQDNELKDFLNISLDLTSDIRMKVIEMYALDFKYDYIGKLSYLKNPLIDNSINNVNYNNMSNLYVDDLGNIKFVQLLYNPDFNKDVLYYFTIDKNKNINLECKLKR